MQNSSVKKKCLTIFMCLTVLFCLSAGAIAVEEYIKNIEVGESDIKIDHGDFPFTAYLYIELKNGGDKNIANLAFEISYYDKEGYLIEKSVLKNALTESLPKKETRKYKIRLNGNVMNTAHEQYPYSHYDKVGEFDIKIIGVKFAPK